MQSFTRLLRLMTKEYHLTTLLINNAVKTDFNQQSAFTSTSVKPALGVTWTFTSDMTILMHKYFNDAIILEILRSRTGVLTSNLEEATNCCVGNRMVKV